MENAKRDVLKTANRRMEFGELFLQPDGLKECGKGEGFVVWVDGTGWLPVRGCQWIRRSFSDGCGRRIFCGRPGSFKRDTGGSEERFSHQGRTPCSNL